MRFAPSPTGYFHVGGAKTALYNWLFARQHGGTFVLRIEDTDTERNRAESIEGIRARSGGSASTGTRVRIQSQRAHLYDAEATRLFTEVTGTTAIAPVTWSTPERRVRRTGYDGFCRERGLGPGEGRALRFRTPAEGATTVVEMIRGKPEFPNAAIEDFVIVRGNGRTMFLFANVVDDIDMGISHVIRAEEHLPNTPKASLLWGALDGGELPVFAHVPVLVNEKRQKLSKRRDQVTLEMYRDEGCLPDRCATT